MDVTLEREANGGILVKILGPAWEVNVRATTEILTRLTEIRSTDWDQRQSLQIGESAGAPVFWSCRDDQVTLMIGHDDETWDVAVIFPVAVVHAILGDLARL